MKQINHAEILKYKRFPTASLRGTEPKLLFQIYRFMLRLRRLQEEIIKEYHPADEIRCPVHFCIGQEAAPAVLSCLITKDDILLSSHRSHGYYFAKGGGMKELLAELYGRKTGVNSGKAGSQEISVPEINFYSGAILSGSLAIAVGIGLGFKLKKKTNISVVGFGDGAVDEGIFWEAINYVQLHKLPVIFICENNSYSTYSHLLKRQPEDNIHIRVRAFGLKTYALFGNDVVSLIKNFKKAFEYVRTGNGPVFIESYTYRWNAHVGPEDDDYIGYRSEYERAFWRNNCPILLLEERMFDTHQLTRQLREEILIEINNEIKEAFEFAKGSPFPATIDWEKENYCQENPLADRLLKDFSASAQFDQNQRENIPGPY